MTVKVITGVNTRWSYANVWEPKAIEGGKPKFSVSLIIPKSDTVTVGKIKAAIEEAYREGQSKLKGNAKSVPALSTLRTPLRDGDLERPDDEAYANAYFVNANSATAPGVVDANRNEFLDKSEVYSGVYGRASITFYAFNANGNRASPAGLTTCRRSGTANLWAAEPAPRATLPPQTMKKIFWDSAWTHRKSSWRGSSPGCSAELSQPLSLSSRPI
jgi:hypothetical protein